MSGREGWDLWLRWVLAHAAGGTLGVAASVALGMPCLFACGYLGVLLGPLVVRVVLASVLGWAQEHVLWPDGSSSWLRASILGGVVALSLDAGIQSGESTHTLNWLVGGAVSGAVIGGAQWFVTRESYPRAWAWIPANLVGWSVGLVLADLLYTILFGPDRLHVPSAQVFLDYLLFLLNPLIRFVAATPIAAIITGVVLLWIRQERLPTKLSPRL